MKVETKRIKCTLCNNEYLTLYVKERSLRPTKSKLVSMEDYMKGFSFSITSGTYVDSSAMPRILKCDSCDYQVDYPQKHKTKKVKS